MDELMKGAEISAAEPENLAAEAEIPAAEPEDLAAEPEISASEPEIFAAEPEIPASEPENLAAEPENLAAEPKIFASGPENLAAAPQVPVDGSQPPVDELSTLRQQLDELRERFEQQRTAMERMSRECDEFCELYPDRPLASLPREVWDSVRNGIPLAAAYAYAEARRTHALRMAEQTNDRNRASSSGDVSGRTRDYFSPAEVRKMSATEVRTNYSKIMDSMKLWS